MIEYFYAPIPYYQGQVLKCQGIATSNNKVWMLKKHPDMIVLKGYRGDRIGLDYSEF